MIAVIGEKPSVARDIARILGANEKQDGYLSGNGYLVTWAFGHLVGLAMPEAYGIQSFRRESLPIIPENFQLTPRQVKAEKGYKYLFIYTHVFYVLILPFLRLFCYMLVTRQNGK